MWNRLLYLLAVALVVFTLVILFQGAADSVTSGPITIGTGDVDGLYYVLGGVTAKLVNERADELGFRMLVEPTEGSVEIIDRIAAGEMAFGVAQADIELAAVMGTGPWAETGGHRNLRAVCSLHEELVTLVATDASGIESVADLRDRRVDLGPVGSGTRANALRALAAGGLDADLDLDASAYSGRDAARLLESGALDAMFWTTGHPSALIAEVSANAAIHFVPVIIDTKGLASKEGDAPSYLQRSQIPAHLYPRMSRTEAVDTIGTRAILVTSARMGERVVYEVTRSLFEQLRRLRRLHPGLARLEPDRMTSGFAAPLHPGAERYYQESGRVR